MNSVEVEYVPQKIFDLKLESMKEKAGYDKEITEEKLDKFQAVMEKNFATMQASINNLHGEIKVLDEKIDGVNKRVDGLEKRFDDMKEYQNKWFSLFGILFTAAAILAPVAVAIVQKVVK